KLSAKIGVKFQMENRFAINLFKILGATLILLSTFAIAGNANWDEFQQQFITQDGRITDTGNSGISHTEGQGLAMLLSVQYNDQTTFDRIWYWTKSNLQVREDKLFAWSWSPSEGVKDFNNASDGDLFIAWALSRAYSKWKSPEYLAASIEISQAIRGKLLRKTNRGIVITPGLVGFDSPEGQVINLSYWVFPAIDDLNAVDPSPQWSELKSSGTQLIKSARFGKWHLPPDWLLIGNAVSPTKNNQFRYDAVRIPLYLIWGKVANKELMKPFKDFWGSFKETEFLPSWTNLDNNTVGAYNASAGFHNIAKLALAYPQIETLELAKPSPSENYYSYMLTLFTQLALDDLKK
ncbi:MAG TPA: glycosyl hydrolase family 8, partial [Thiolinea sp.]|nr:glycosyl hydrolase family 8 [Thiolinea sp.]